MIVDALFVYPVKSCAGVSVERARVTKRGFEHDRRWMVTDADGKFLTQRTLPAMQAIRVAIERDGFVVTAPGQPPLSLPHLFSDGARVPIAIWKHEGEAVRHDAGSAWFSRALGRPLQLVCMPDAIERPVRSFAQPGDVVSFADEYPFLVVNRASLDDLNARSKLRTDVRRFRPSLVVAGAPPWAEDEWRRIRVGAVPMRLPKGCARCTIPSIDPDTLEITKEPLRTLATFRTRDHEVWFGINGIADVDGRSDEELVLRVGDPVALVDM